MPWLRCLPVCLLPSVVLGMVALRGSWLHSGHPRAAGDVAEPEVDVATDEIGGMAARHVGRSSITMAAPGLQP